jgi:hypothetical protein
MKKIILFPALVFALFSCSTDNTSEESEQPKNVYVLGYEKESGINTLKLWKNGVSSNVSDGIKTALPRDLYVDGNNVYVVGCQEDLNGVRQAALWKNGVKTSLSNGTGQNYANGVFVQNNQVNVVGSINAFQEASYWLNGAYNTLPVTSTFSKTADKIHGDANNICIAGEVIESGSKSKAVVWINNTLFNLTDGTTRAIPQRVLISGGFVYTLLYLNNKTVIAKTSSTSGTTLIELMTQNGVDAHPTDFAITSSGDTYVVGYEVINGFDTPFLFKNGVRQNYFTTVPTSVIPTSIFIDGVDVYVSGTEDTVSGVDLIRVWKNGQIQNINLSSAAQDRHSTRIIVK